MFIMWLLLGTFPARAARWCEFDLAKHWTMANAVIVANTMTPKNAYAVQSFVLARFLTHPLPLATLTEEPSEADQRKVLEVALKFHREYKVKAKALSDRMPHAVALDRARGTIVDTARNVRHVLNQIVVSEIFDRVTASDKVDEQRFDEYFAAPERYGPAVVHLRDALTETFQSKEFGEIAEKYQTRILRASGSEDPAVRASVEIYVQDFDRELNQMFLRRVMRTGDLRAREYLQGLPR